MLKNLRVKTKLLLGFGSLAAVVLAVSGLALHSLGESHRRFTDYLEGVGQRERLAVELRGAASRRAIAARNLVLVVSDTDRDTEKAAVAQAHDDVRKALDALKASLVGPGVTERDKALVAAIEAVEGRYGPVAQGIVEAVLAGRIEEGTSRMNKECRPLLAALLKATGDYIAYENRQAEAAATASAAGHAVDRALLVGAALAAVASAIGLGWVIAAAVTRPLQRAVDLAQAVAAGDLGTRIEVDRRDETGQLLAALKRMNDNLAGMVAQVRQAADGIAVASGEIASGNRDLSGRTEQQASALQQTAASMQQMTSTVQQNAEAARQASSLAGSASAAAGRGGEVVGRVVTTMEDITASSKRIADIIGVIDGIAFQTNILALNAAVEAARAGEQGRGFAVVAGEVRTLAQRSAEAAKEIKGLISASVERVEAGSQLVAEAGHAMGDIVAQVQRMTDLMGEIDAATSEQSQGILQVSQAVSSIDEGTQQNAALVEQGSAAAESLRQQADGLIAAMGVFRVPAAA